MAAWMEPSKGRTPRSDERIQRKRSQDHRTQRFVYPKTWTQRIHEQLTWKGLRSFVGENLVRCLCSPKEKNLVSLQMVGCLHWGCDIREAQAFLCLSPHQTRQNCAKHLGKLWRYHSTGLIPGFWVQILKRYECLVGFGDHQGNFSLDATPLEAELMSTCSCWFLTVGDAARWECRAHCPTLARSWSWGRNTWCASLLTCRVCVFKKATATLWVPATHECLVRISVRPLSSHTYDGDRHVGEIIIESLVFGDEISTQAALLFGLGCSGQTDMTFALIHRWFCCCRCRYGKLEGS